MRLDITSDVTSAIKLFPFAIFSICVRLFKEKRRYAILKSIIRLMFYRGTVHAIKEICCGMLKEQAIIGALDLSRMRIGDVKNPRF